MPNIIQPKNIDSAALLLQAGGVVAIPTETVYGLAADISNEQAVRQIFALKQRPIDHPLIIHICDLNQLEQFAIKIPEYAFLLARSFWPGPLTLVLYKSQLVGDWVTGGQDTVGIRMPNHPLTLSLINRVGSPLAAPSANQFGKISPTHISHVAAEFGERVPVLDGGHCMVGIESTIVDATEEMFCTILRPGMISEQALKAVLGNHIEIKQPNNKSKQVSGTLKTHYAPQKPTYLFAGREELLGIKSRTAKSVYGLVLTEDCKQLCQQSSLMSTTSEDYAQKLYNALRTADNSDCDIIAIERPPRVQEWQGIMDRLERSSAATMYSAVSHVESDESVI
ncbi:MAG: L-threonylcarbamoyladenylate synthase [Candidatus Berkiella sp.]